MTPDRSDFIAWAFDELFGAKKNTPDLERVAVYLAAAKGAPMGHEFYGNQWTTGGYVSGYGGKYARVDEPNPKQLDDWARTFDPNDDVQKMAVEVGMSALEWEGSKGVYDKTGKMQAIFHGEIADQDEAASYMGVDIEATRPYLLGELAVHPDNLKPDGERGWGVKTLYEAAKDAANQKANGFYLHSASPQSDRFYEKCGMTKLAPSTYGWDGADLRYFVRSWEKYGGVEE